MRNFQRAGPGHARGFHFAAGPAGRPQRFVPQSIWPIENLVASFLQFMPHAMKVFEPAAKTAPDPRQNVPVPVAVVETITGLAGFEIS